jgi:hypothetical protein
VLLKVRLSHIGNKRLLIVGEGVLCIRRFALPEREPAPLMVRHEIVTRPPASVLAVLRWQETAGPQARREAWPCSRTRCSTPMMPARPPGRRLVRSGSDPGMQDFARLRPVAQKPREITRLAGSGAHPKRSDF